MARETPGSPRCFSGHLLNGGRGEGEGRTKFAGPVLRCVSIEHLSSLVGNLLIAWELSSECVVELERLDMHERGDQNFMRHACQWAVEAVTNWD